MNGSIESFPPIVAFAMKLRSGGTRLGTIAPPRRKRPSNFDQTSGGHEPPYTGYTGKPIDWNRLDVTNTGMAHRGHVVNVLVDCTSGMMHFELVKLAILFREFSPRALAVHKPRQACQERGFRPAF